MLHILIAFLLTALLYASVGFGGGSTYTAILALAGTDYRAIPVVSLVCNLVVVTGGTWRFWRAGAIDWQRLLPLVALSAPFAWLGGFLPIREAVFMILLGCSLLVAGVLLLIQRETVQEAARVAPTARAFDYVAGMGTGFLAGMVGIGGGIFLAPLLHLTRWGSARAIAAAASLFIFVNSLAGLAGQLMKAGSITPVSNMALAYWPLVIAVLIGGQIGTHAGLRLFSAAILRKATGVLILYVAVTVLWKAVTA